MFNFLVEASCIFIFGLLMGRWAYYLSLLYEGRRKLSIYRCSSCGKRGHFLPLLSYFWSCSKCSRKPDPLCNFVELITGLVFLSIFYILSWKWWALEVAIFSFMAIIACVVDIKRTILPDTLTLGGLALALLGAWLNPEREFLTALIGMAVGGGSLFAIGLIYYFLRKQEGMGGGDVKMLAWIGALIGFQGVIYVLLLASVLSLLFAGLFVVLSSINIKKWATYEIAFGPYLAVAVYIYILVTNIYFI